MVEKVEVAYLVAFLKVHNVVDAMVILTKNSLHILTFVTAKYPIFIVIFRRKEPAKTTMKTSFLERDLKLDICNTIFLGSASCNRATSRNATYLSPFPFPISCQEVIFAEGNDIVKNFVLYVIFAQLTCRLKGFSVLFFV